MPDQYQYMQRRYIWGVSYCALEHSSGDLMCEPCASRIILSMMNKLYTWSLRDSDGNASGQVRNAIAKEEGVYNLTISASRIGVLHML